MKIRKTKIKYYNIVRQCDAKQLKNNKNVVCPYVKLTNLLTFKLDFQKGDQHTGGKWLIHGTKRRKGNQLQTLELPRIISY